ncbi:MAG: RIP metalloprotease RseP [Beijerinckiaceae bacterium]
MDFVSALGSNLWSVLSYALPFLFLLCVVVFIHELGHFLAGRWCGVKVKTFSVGFGPEILGFNDRYGTRWQFSAIPLGGYVKFFGDLNAASSPDFANAERMSEAEKQMSFPHKSVGQRAFIVAAGPMANFLLSIVLFAGLAMAYGRLVVDPVVGTIVPNSAAERAGFMPGDKILRINGAEIVSFEALQRLVSASPEIPLTVVLQRRDSETTLTVTPELKEIKSRLGVARIGRLGIGASPETTSVRTETFGPLKALAHGVSETWHVVERTMSYIGKLMIGRESADQLSGLPRIVQASGEVTQSSGFSGLLALTALMSVSIGLLNLFPIPLLDGGHLMFYAYEWLRKKPLSERKQEIGFKIGFALVIGLMIFATWNDILHFVSL